MYKSIIFPNMKEKDFFLVLVKFIAVFLVLFIKHKTKQKDK